jgi:hypothetical protein
MNWTGDVASPPFSPSPQPVDQDGGEDAAGSVHQPVATFPVSSSNSRQNAARTSSVSCSSS